MGIELFFVQFALTKNAELSFFLGGGGRGTVTLFPYRKLHLFFPQGGAKQTFNMETSVPG